MYDSGKILSSWTCKCDDSGNVLYGITYKADGSIESLDSGKHDDKGHNTASLSRAPDGKLTRKSVCKYDSQGNKTEFTYYADRSGIIDAEYFEYTYDQIGNMTRKKTYEMRDGKKITTQVAEYQYVYY